MYELPRLLLVIWLVASPALCLTNLLINLSLIKKHVPKVEEMVSSVCYPEVESCFHQNPVYDLKNRRLTFYTPQNPLKLSIRFILLNKVDEDIEKGFSFYFNNLTDQLVGQIPFTGGQQTLVFVPGWTEDYADSKHWIQSLDGFPNKESYQLIVVDWSECSLRCTYEESVTNSKVISKVLSVVLLQLNAKGKIDLTKTHLVGKDLGAHIAGQVGHELTNRKNTKLFKITAFDPPLDLFEERSDVDRIDQHDASHVEVVHTNTHRKEFVQSPAGLVDVFVYDSHRPNIPALTSLLANQSRFSSNSEVDLRMRAVLRSNLTLRNEKDCHLIAFRCDSYANFLDGKCSVCDDERNCKLIGLWSNQLSTKFEKSGKPFHYYSVQSTDKAPCVYHYLVQVTIGGIFKNRKSRGILEVTIQNETVYIQDEFSRNQTYTKLYTSVKPLTSLKQVKVSYVNLATGLWVFTYSNAIHVDRIRLNYLSSLDDKTRQDYSSLYCLSHLGTNVIAHKQFINLKRCQANQTD